MSWTLGVANKELACGTLVRICLHEKGGPCITVHVVDRGPYIAGRDFDLTEATKRALGYEGIEPVWTAY